MTVNFSASNGMSGLQPGLITDGMFRYIRHPNYLGEMMIYGSFALMVWHWLPFVVLAWFGADYSP